MLCDLYLLSLLVFMALLEDGYKIMEKILEQLVCRCIVLVGR